MNGKPKDNILTRNPTLFLPLLRNPNPSYVHLWETYTAAYKLSCCTPRVTKAEATLGNTLSKIVRDALTSDRCINLFATSPLFEPRHWATSSWEQPKSLRVLDNPTRKLCRVSPAWSLDSKRCFLKRLLTPEQVKSLFPADPLRSVTLKRYPWSSEIPRHWQTAI